MLDPAIVLLQTLLLVALAPLWSGVVAALEARLQMRRGAPLLQRYRDLARLARKETVWSSDASAFARVTPLLVFGATLTACLWAPVISARPGLGFAGDLVTLVALLAGVRALLALLAMENGVPFGGMAASRHLALSALAEPALMIAVFTLAIAAHSTDLAHVSASVARAPAAWLSPSHLLALAAMALVVLSETGRVPVDNPFTHLELTMIHEGLSLDVSGRALALLDAAAQVRQLLLLTLLVNLFAPWGIALESTPGALALGLAAWLAKVAALAVAVAVLESVVVRMRLFRVPEFLGMAFLLALLALTSDSLLR